MKAFLLSAHILLLALGVCGENVLLHDASDLISFSNNVNSRKDYTGTTVFLDADIDFSGYSDAFKPIGAYSDDNSLAFKGTFDGQGHAIRNLKINSTSDIAGFFGYSYGVTIKNIVFDSSCSFTSTASGDGVTRLGPISHVNGVENIIENIVNMANMTVFGSNANYIVAGGIVGKAGYKSTLKNCVNYGRITVSGTYKNIFVGGIAGEFIGAERVKSSIQNCINYGPITNEKKGNEDTYIGGIAGNVQNLFSIESCVNTGEIAFSFTFDNDNSVGGIVGRVYKPGSSSTLTNSFWTNKDIEGIGLYSSLEGQQRYVDKPGSSQADEMNETILKTLNGGSSGSGSEGKWLLNSNSYTVTFYVNNKVHLSSTATMILAPSFEEERASGNFTGWFTDASCTTSFTSSTITGDTDLYGIHKTLVTITFDANGGTLTSPSSSSSNSSVVTYSNAYGELPGATRTEHAFLGWFTKTSGGDRIESTTSVANADSHTLYAQWAINKYTVFFDLSNGTVIESAFGYNETIVYPDNETIYREGFIFGGWNSSVTLMPGENISIEALWTEIIHSSSSSSIVSSSSSSISSSSSSSVFSSSSSTSSIISSSSSSVIRRIIPQNASEYVKIEFGAKDMTQKDVEDFVRKYTGGNAFTIEEFSSENGITVIIRFEDTEKATNFIETIKAASGSIESVMTIEYTVPSVGFSPSTYGHISAFLTFTFLLTF